MREKWERDILNLLLDKYERTEAYRSGTLPGKRVILNLYGGEKSDFPAYNIEDHLTRTDINRVVLRLSQIGYIFFEWFRGEENHILKRLWLNVQRVGDVYDHLNRIPLRDQALTLISELERELSAVSSEWIVAYYSEMINHIREKMKRSSLLPDDTREREQLYRMLRVIDSGTVNAVSERVFSEICFGDSKRFENRLRQVLLAVMRKYFSSEMTDAELLRSIGISRYPEPLELRGNIIVNSNRMITLKCGFCVYSNEIEDIQLSPGPDVTRIITIENRANYFAYRQSDNELVVYHGGHFSPAKKTLFLKLADAMPEKCIWYHWGDIDFGGFSMLMRLRSEILASIRPYRMNREELVSYSDYTRPFQQEYAQKLRALAEHPLLSDCKECLEYMIKNSVKLEQEAMLT